MHENQAEKNNQIDSLAIEVEPTKHVGVEGVLNLRQRDLSKWSNAQHSCVIDKNIDPPELVKNIGEHARHALLRQNVEFLRVKPWVILKI